MSGILPSELAVADEVHYVVTVSGLNDAGLTNGASLVEDPILEFFNHLALSYALVNNVGVSGLFLAELLESRLSLLTCKVICKDLVSLSLCLSLFLVGDGGAGLVVIEAYKNVSNILGLGLVKVSFLFKEVNCVGRLLIALGGDGLGGACLSLVEEPLVKLGDLISLGCGIVVEVISLYDSVVSGLCLVAERDRKSVV